MKNKAITLGVLLVIFLGAGLQAQTTGRKTAKAASRSTNNDEQIVHDIQELERSLRAAFVDGNSSWWERHLDEHYAGMNPDGQLVNKATTIRLYGSSDVKYDEVNLGDMGARIYGDTVIATTKSSISGSYKGKDFSGDYYFVHVWTKEGAEWKLANSQATRLPAETTSGGN